jgi:uncharacterized membrane protein HdeD (DUF308 family)
MHEIKRKGNLMNLLETIKKDAKTSKWVGILLLIAGFLSLVAPFGAGLSVTVMVGVLMLFSGVAQLFLVFKAGSFGEGILLALFAILTLVAGGYMLSQPVEALAALTLFLAAYFVASGVIQIVGAFGARPQAGWGWLLFGGIVSILLGAMIWRQFPLSGAWAVGTLVGVQLVMSGWTLIAVGGVAKDAVDAAQDGRAS